MGTHSIPRWSPNHRLPGPVEREEYISLKIQEAEKGDAGLPADGQLEGHPGDTRGGAEAVAA